MLYILTFVTFGFLILSLLTTMVWWKFGNNTVDHWLALFVIAAIACTMSLLGTFCHCSYCFHCQPLLDIVSHCWFVITSLCLADVSQGRCAGVLDRSVYCVKVPKESLVQDLPLSTCPQVEKGQERVGS